MNKNKIYSSFNECALHSVGQSCANTHTCKLVGFSDRSSYHELKKILNSADDTGKLARGRLHVMEYNLEITHCADIEHQAADALIMTRYQANG